MCPETLADVSGNPSVDSARVCSPRLHVAFVCTFNRARSVTAAVMFAEQLRRVGLGDLVRVSSAGTAPDVGSPADPRAVQVLANHGYVMPNPQHVPPAPGCTCGVYAGHARQYHEAAGARLQGQSRPRTFATGCRGPG